MSILTTPLFSDQRKLTAKLLWGYLIHDTEMSPSTSKALAQLCLTSLCIKWVLFLVQMTNSNLAVPWVWFVHLNENKNVFCTTVRWYNAGLLFKNKKINSILQTWDTEATVRLLFCTLINVTFQIPYANNSPFNWYWVRDYQNKTRIGLQFMLLAFAYDRQRFITVINYNQWSCCFCNNVKADCTHIA